MLTDKCRTIIDEALSASQNGTKLSEQASAHIAGCSECRRSIEAINSLQASVGSVLISESNSSLKQKISSKLEAAMQARKAATLSSTVVAGSTAISSAAKVALASIGLAAAAIGSAVILNCSSPNKAPVKNAATTITQNSCVKAKDVLQKTDGEDLKNPEPIKLDKQKVPSPNKD